MTNDVPAAILEGRPVPPPPSRAMRRGGAGGSAATERAAPPRISSARADLTNVISYSL